MDTVRRGSRFLVAAHGIIFLSLLVACGPVKVKKPAPSGYSDEEFTARLRSVLRPADTSQKRRLPSVVEAVRFVYAGDDYQPVWVRENYRPTAAAASLISDLEDMRWDGLPASRYNISEIRRLKTILDTTGHNNVAQAVAFDTLLTHCYLAASHDLLFGYISSRSVDSLWYHANDSSWMAPQVLANAAGYVALDTYRSKVATYALLRTEYKRYTDLITDSVLFNAITYVRHLPLQAHYDDEALDNINTVIHSELPWLDATPNDSISEEKQLLTTYQQYMGIPVSARFDSATLDRLTTLPAVYLQKIAANMERVRWMQKDFGSRYLIVDVPLMELFLRDNDTNAMHMRVVVGKPERQTPSLFANMANIVINPPWGVPPTILKQDVLPGLQKSGRLYLAKKGLKVYDRKGNRINASAINARNYRTYTYKQDPGDDNSLGYVKFNLPNPWDIYLHDTPHRDDFGKRFRALSSGCIRLQRPQQMALFILSEFEKKRYYTQGRLDTIIDTHKTRWEVLKNKIPVHIAYLTAFEDTTGKHMQFTRDIYGRDIKLLAAIK
jgi:L,D-transpeptidase YcbB